MFGRSEPRAGTQPGTLERRRVTTPGLILQIAGVATGWTLAIAIVLANKLTELGNGNGLPGRDSGVFATIADYVRQGYLPYRDFWDHKPPGIYYIDALIFSTLSPSPWSLHVGEAVLALACLLAFFWLALSLASPLLAALGTAIFGLFSTLPALNQGGGFAETYWPLPASITYGSLMWYLVRACPARECLTDARAPGVALSQPAATGSGAPALLVLAGVASACALLLKPQGVFFVVGTVVVLLVAHPPGRASPFQQPRWCVPPMARLVASEFGIFGLAFLCILAPVVLYFRAQGALPELWSQVVAYNGIYTRTIPLSRYFPSFVSAADSVPEVEHLWVLTVATLAMAVKCLAGSGRQPVANSQRSGDSGSSRSPGAYQGRSLVWGQLIVLVTWFALDFAGAAAGGRFYQHYFLLTVPSSVSLLTFCFAGVVTSAFRPKALVVLQRAAMAALGISIVVVSSAIFAVRVRAVGPILPRLNVETRPAAAPWSSDQVLLDLTEGGSFPVLGMSGWRVIMRADPPPSDEKVAAEIRARTNPDDYLLVWGADASLYFLSGRRPSSRYIYDYPLIDRFGDTMARGYSTPEQRSTFLGELRARPPQLVVIAPEHRDSVALVPGFPLLLRDSYVRTQVVDGFDFYERLPRALENERPSDARFGDSVQLVGYVLRWEPGVVRISLVWRSLRPTPRKLVASVQALDATGRLVAQDDREPVHGRLPTTDWVPGELVRDDHQVYTTQALTSQIIVVMYDRQTLVRLPVANGDGQNFFVIARY